MRDPAGRISAKLQAILAHRAKADDPASAPKVLSPSHLMALRAVLSHMVPHTIAGLDLAQRIDADLAAGSDNGWRLETMPDDARAHRDALTSLDAAARASGASGFADLPADRQAAMLAKVAEGAFDAPAGAPMTAGQLSDWFTELLSDAVRLYVAHPATISSIGYEGHANGAHSGAAFEGWTDREIEDVR